MYADILVEVGSIDKTFTYKVPFGIDALVGMRALVPFGNRELEGYILKIYQYLKKTSNVTLTHYQFLMN